MFKKPFMFASKGNIKVPDTEPKKWGEANKRPLPERGMRTKTNKARKKKK